jgi:hypothetical protein
VVDPKPSAARGTASIPPELEARLAALEREASRTDFDSVSWFWMLVFGIAVPLVLLVVGWWA